MLYIGMRTKHRQLLSQTKSIFSRQCFVGADRENRVLSCILLFLLQLSLLFSQTSRSIPNTFDRIYQDKLVISSFGQDTSNLVIKNQSTSLWGPTAFHFCVIYLYHSVFLHSFRMLKPSKYAPFQFYTEALIRS